MLVGVRIIAGAFRSRRLDAPAGLSTRPTSDRLRETLFNVLAPKIQGAAFLDLYAGSGAVGLEALSEEPRTSPLLIGRSRRSKCCAEIWPAWESARDFTLMTEAWARFFALP